jgi:hypothetical protein
MSTFTKTEQATLAPLIAALATATAALATAGDVTADADAQLVALLGKIAALGSEPQPNDFETSASWQAALGEHRFSIAKLQPGIAPLEAKVSAAQAEYATLAPAVHEAQIVVDLGVVRILAARLAAAREHSASTVIAYQRELQKLPAGRAPDHPHGMIYQALGLGVFKIGLTRNVDMTLVPVD